MSDLPSNDGQHRQRRNARRRAGVGASAHKKNTPAAMSDEQSQAEKISRPLTSGEVTKRNTQETEAAQSAEETAAPQEDLAPANTGRGVAMLWRRLSPLTRQVLLWGAISGTAVFAFSTGLGLVLGQITDQTTLQVGICLSDIITLGLFAFGGMRATSRLGMPRHAGVTGAWGSCVAFLLSLAVSLVLLLTGAQKLDPAVQGAVGQAIINTLSYALFNMALGFAAGWIGGRYAEWKRNKAKRQQEAAVAP